MVDLKENGKSVSVEPTLLRISDKLSLRYAKLGNGSPLVLLHTIRTQLEYFRALAPLLAEKFTADPVFDRMSRDGQNVVPGLGRQIAVPGEPVRNTGRTGIVGGGSQSKIAETLLESGEKFGGFWYCFFGIERIGKATRISRLRHELRDALRTGWTDRLSAVGSTYT